MRSYNKGPFTGELRDIQDRLVDYFLNFQNKEALIDYIDIIDIEIKAGTNNIIHKLGKIPTGYIVIRSNANINVWDSGLDSSKILLNSSGNAKISLRVF